MCKKNKSSKGNAKNIVFLIILIGLLIIGLSVIVPIAAIYVPQAEDSKELAITVIIACLTYVGTLVLGIITYWQTKNANELSVLLAKKETSSYVRPGCYAKFKLSKMNVKAILEFAEKHPSEFVICSEKTKEQIVNSELNCETEMLEFTLELQIENAPLDNICLNSFGFNTSLQSEGVNVYQKIYNVLNNNSQFSVVYDPQRRAYFLIIYFTYDAAFFKLLHDKSLIVIDLQLTAESIHGMKSSEKICVNVEALPDYDKFIKNKEIEIELKNITIHKGE